MGLYAQNLGLCMALVLPCYVILDPLTILSLILVSCEMKIIKVPHIYYGDLIIQ